MSAVRCSLLLLLGFVTAASSAREPVASPVTPGMRDAAIAWLESLDETQRERATFKFDGPERTDWNFVPMERVGLAMKDMSLEQRRAARRLLRSALSDRGVLKVDTIMALELMLRVMESGRENVESIRDPEKYHFSLFGDPSSDEPWGWRIEGHHVSLNFASIGLDGEETTTATPIFLGANPAELRVGSHLGMRVLGEEDDLGRAVMAALTPDQQAKATLDAVAPDDVAGVPGAPPKVEGPAGLPVSEMTPNQAALVRRVVESYAHLLRPHLAEQLLAEIDEAGYETVHFAWAGSQATLTDAATPVRHYFRVHGPTFILEYDFQEPNHVHSVWHSTTDDFGLETLRRHYEEHPH